MFVPGTSHQNCAIFASNHNFDTIAVCACSTRDLRTLSSFSMLLFFFSFIPRWVFYFECATFEFFLRAKMKFSCSCLSAVTFPRVSLFIIGSSNQTTDMTTLSIPSQQQHNTRDCITRRVSNSTDWPKSHKTWRTPGRFRKKETRTAHQSQTPMAMP